jgi:hypothetical protein
MISVLCALILFANAGRSQGQKITQKRPSVYLTFQGFVKKTASEADPSDGARMLLHNNTRWTILYGEWLERALPGDVAMIYTVELENGCMGGKRHFDVVTVGKLLPGKSVSFTVPREDFPKNSEIFVEVDYSWELVKGERVRNEAVHRTYFLSSALPAWPVKQ